MSTPPPHRVSRRRALKATALTTLGLAAAGGAIASQKPAPRTHGELAALTPVEHAQLSVLCETLCPGEPGRFPSSAEVDLPALVDARIAMLEADTREQIRVAIALFDNALMAALSGDGVRPFSALPLEERSAAVERWRHSAVGFRRTLFKALTGLIHSTYWVLPEAEAGAGYGGPPDAAKLREAYSDDLVDLGALRATKKAGG
jgi:hypothetical protein